MKKVVKILTFSVVMLAFATSAFAQLSDAATATATATILAPISINTDLNMDFGTIVPNVAGTVALATTGVRTAVGPQLPPPAGNGVPATFTVTGQANAVYTVGVAPASVNITSGANTMAVGTFVNDATGNLGAGGSETFRVGATLTVAAAQPAGVYTSAVGSEFTVTVNYN